MERLQVWWTITITQHLPKKMIDIIRSSHILCISYDIKSYLPLQAWYFRWSQPGTPRAGLVPYRVPAFWCTVLRRDWHEEFWLKPDMESKYSTKLFPGWRFKVSAFQVSIFQDLFEDVSVDLYICVCFRVRMDSPTVRNQLCQGLFWRPKRQPSNNPGIELNQGTQRLRCKIYIRVWNPKGFLIRKIRGYSQHRVSSSPDEHVKDLRLHIVEKADGVRQPWGNGARSLKIEGSGGYLDQIFRIITLLYPAPKTMLLIF